jgi:hypothetical protein
VKGAYFFTVFFLLFVSATLLIPTPMFPGDTFLAMVNLATLEYAYIIGALINALVYSLIAWAIFVLAMKRIGNTATVKQSAKNMKKE